MTDYAAHHPKIAKRAGRSASAGLAFALATLVVLIVAGAGIVALLLWPRSVPVAPDAPSFPITVGGVLFNVPPAAIRVPLQRRPGAQDRVFLIAVRGQVQGVTTMADVPVKTSPTALQYLDKAIRAVMSTGGVVETNRAVVLAALQITGELFEVNASLKSHDDSIRALCDYVRPLLPPAKRQPGAAAAQ